MCIYIYIYGRASPPFSPIYMCVYIIYILPHMSPPYLSPICLPIYPHMSHPIPPICHGRHFLQAIGKVREKMTSVREMIRVANAQHSDAPVGSEP